MRPGSPPDSTHVAHTQPDTTTHENTLASAPAHDDRTARALDIVGALDRVVPLCLIPWCL